MTALDTPAPDPAPLSTHFRAITAWMGRTAAAKAGRDWSWSPLVLILWSYLNRLANRFERLLARIEAGERPRPRSPATGPRIPSDDPLASPPRPRLPRSFGLLARMGYEMRSHGGQIECFLRDPRMKALMDRDPRVARLLRPLCHLLGIRLPAPALPERPAAPPKPPRRADASPPGIADPPANGPPGSMPLPA